MRKEIIKLQNQFKDDFYIKYHAPRYSYLLDLICKRYQKGDRILDIGRSHFTKLLSQTLNTKIDSLGLQNDKKNKFGRHYKFDLNQSQNKKNWIKNLACYDIVIFSEVIEHLYTDPDLVLKFLIQIIKPKGCLILQTPNAAAFHKRIKLLLGRNPYEPIRASKFQPGHFREYTKKEILKYAKRKKLKLEEMKYNDYFDYRYNSHQKFNSFNVFLNLFYSLAPGGLKPGMTFVFKKINKS